VKPKQPTPGPPLRFDIRCEPAALIFECRPRPSFPWRRRDSDVVIGGWLTMRSCGGMLSAVNGWRGFSQFLAQLSNTNMESMDNGLAKKKLPGILGLSFDRQGKLQPRQTPNLVCEPNVPEPDILWGGCMVASTCSLLSMQTTTNRQ
jgi:hypothetical protein